MSNLDGCFSCILSSADFATARGVSLSGYFENKIIKRVFITAGVIVSVAIILQAILMVLGLAAFFFGRH